MTAPLRHVTTAVLREGRTGLLGPDTSRRSRWWDLGLDCGHVEERPARYLPRKARRRQRVRTDVLPAPTRARCFTCQAAYPADAA